MTRYYKAVFSNGRALRRSTTSRVYTHAYLVTGQRQDGQTWEQSGFNGSERLAMQQMTAAKRWSATFAEYAPTVEITRKEYEALACT